jgi:hypothetical protein
LKSGIGHFAKGMPRRGEHLEEAANIFLILKNALNRK